MRPKPRALIGERGSHFLERIEGAVRGNLPACFQCERCTNACPVSADMDIKPHQVIRFVQLGRREALLGSSTIWVCLSCEMCTTYCPNGVGVAETINHLRNLAYRSAIPPREPQLAEFHRTFLEELNRRGRVNELRLMGALNLKPGILAEKIRKGLLGEELSIGLTLLRRGRLKMFTARCRAIGEIRALDRRLRGENG